MMIGAFPISETPIAGDQYTDSIQICLTWFPTSRVTTPWDTRVVEETSWEEAEEVATDWGTRGEPC